MSSGEIDIDRLASELKAIMSKLKGCPFCGGEAELFKMGGLFRTTRFDTYYIECNDCGVQMSACEKMTSQDVVKKWNHRYSDGN